jgi:hypothetical protein
MGDRVQRRLMFFYDTASLISLVASYALLENMIACRM